jgi:hypothetical protein
MVRWLRLLSILVCCALLSTSRAQAAELRITLDELARLVQTIANTTTIYLNSVPGLFASSSYIEIGSQKYGLPRLEKELKKGDSTYAYYVNDMKSTKVRVSTVNSALRLALSMETVGPEATPGCSTGNCPLLSFFPDIEWVRPSVIIDFIPVHFDGSVSLQVKHVRLGSTPQAACQPQADIWARAACSIGRAFANQAISKLRTELPKMVKDAVNQPDVQRRLADGLKGYLTVGQAGAVAINTISVAPNSMTVNFKFSTASTAGN